MKRWFATVFLLLPPLSLWAQAVQEITFNLAPQQKVLSCFAAPGYHA